MRRDRIYLDWAARAPVCESAKQAISGAMTQIGNPSSVHDEGRKSRAIIEDTREKLAQHLRRNSTDILFTSGGTEANNLVLAQEWPAIAISAIEHDSIRAAAPQAHILSVEPSGLLNLSALETWMQEHRGALVSVMTVSNEIGICQPIADIADIVHAHDGWLHTDGVQALGHGLLASSPADFITVSAHKIGGLPGTGALIFPAERGITPVQRGGGQEFRLRPGTENLIGIAGFGGAMAALPHWFEAADKMAAQREQLIAMIQTNGGQVQAGHTPHAPNILAITAPAAKSETQLIRLDLEGFAVSAGSACSSGKVGVNQTLQALGLSDAAMHSTIRVSFGPETTDADLQAFGETWCRFFCT